MTPDDITKAYNKRGSIRSAAADLGVSAGVVRKTLVEHGLIDSPLIRRINELAENGMSQKEIAEALHVSTSCVNANIVYQRGSYLGDDKSANALRIKRWRGEGDGGAHDDP